MPYCSQCGVEVHEKTAYCPLCEAPIQKFEKLDHPERNYPDKPAETPKLPPLTLKERLRIARGISIIVFLIPILLTTALNFFISKEISWSAYVIVSLVGVLGITLLTLFFPKRAGLVNFFTHFIILLVCIFLNSFTGLDFPWSLFLGLPILAGSWMITQGILKVAKLKKGNLFAASILLGISILAIIVDMMINLLFGARLALGWSLIVISAVFPTALLLIYLDSARFRKSKLRRFMHL